MKTEDTVEENETELSPLDPENLEEDVPMAPSPDLRTLSGRLSVDTSFMWLLAYFFNGLILTIYNKAAMQFLNFKYPWALTGIHNLFSAVGCYFLYTSGAFKPARLSRRGNYIMLAFSFLYTINIGMSNVSLNLVTVPFHQIVRATTPVFVLLINVMWLGKWPAQKVLISLIPTILGVGVATYGDYYFTAWGFFLTVLGTVLSAFKGVVTNQVQVGELKLHPMDLLMRMAPLACVQTFIASYFSGELDRMSANFDWTFNALMILAGNGILAFSMNLVSFTANKKTSALTMGVAGNVKQVLSIVIAVVVFSLHITITNFFGILITLFGGAYYSVVDLAMRKSANRTLVTHNVTQNVSNGLGLNVPMQYVNGGYAEGKRATMSSPSRGMYHSDDLMPSERAKFIEGHSHALFQDSGHDVKVLVR